MIYRPQQGLSAEGLPTVRTGFLQLPEFITSVAFTGASAAGKSHLARLALEHPSVDESFALATRAIERPQRVGDDLAENAMFGVAPEYFTLTASKGFTIQMQKPMGDGVEAYYYSFDQVQHRGKVPLVPGNLGLVQLADFVVPRFVANNMLIIGVDAPDSEREEEFINRSSDIVENDPLQAAFRMHPTAGRAVLDVVVEGSHFVVNNSKENWAQASVDIIELLCRVAEVAHIDDFPRPLPYGEPSGGFLQSATSENCYMMARMLDGGPELVDVYSDYIESDVPGEAEAARRTLDWYLHLALRIIRPDAGIHLGPEFVQATKGLLINIFNMREFDHQPSDILG